MIDFLLSSSLFGATDANKWCKLLTERVVFDLYVTKRMNRGR
jgi:hypothetical protein